jgi:hypothetical protein
MHQHAATYAPRLHLHALDADDLECLSALMQDALLRVGDIAFLPERQRFALVVSRFDWAGEGEGRLERARSGLHFDHVTRARCQNMARDRPDGVLCLLAIVCTGATEAPACQIRLIFAGGAEILLDTECVEAHLADLGPRWAVAARPTHKLDEGASAGS